MVWEQRGACKQSREALALLLAEESACREVFTDELRISLAQFLTTVGQAQLALGEAADAEARLLEAQSLLQGFPAPIWDSLRMTNFDALISLYEQQQALERAAAVRSQRQAFEAARGKTETAPQP